MAIAAETLEKPSQHVSHNHAKKYAIGETARALDRRLGKALFDNGALNEANFKRILTVQREHGGRFSDVAMRLGVISELEVRRALARQCELPAVLPDMATYHHRLVAAHKPFSARSEAFRTLRSELMLRWFLRGRKCLAITEARQHEGAAVVAANVAWLCAQLGQRTLLIDANLRHSQIDTLFKSRSRFGLTDFLKGDCEFENCLVTMPGIDHLAVLFAGKRSSNPQELLSLGAFGYLMETAGDYFDIVVVTGPPMLECADMQIIAAHVGGYVLSVKRHRTRVADIGFVQQRMNIAAAEQVAMVLDG